MTASRARHNALTPVIRNPTSVIPIRTRYNKHMPISQSEARAWMDRWKAVDEHSREELRRMTLEQKFAQLSSLMQSASLFDWPESDREQDQAVIDRWMLLRERLRE